MSWNYAWGDTHYAIPEGASVSNGTTSKPTGGEGPNSVWALIEEIQNELHQHDFSASNAPAISEIEAQLKEAQAGALRAYDRNLSIGNRSNGHRGGSFESRSRGGRGGRGGGGGLGGGGLAGPGGLGKLPQLGNVPINTPSGTQSANPMAIILVVAILGIGGYLLYHRLRMAHAQEKALDTGKEPPADAST